METVHVIVHIVFVVLIICGNSILRKKTIGLMDPNDWKMKLSKILPKALLVMGILVAVISFLLFNNSGASSNAALDCGWCDGYGCSYCSNRGWYIGTKTTYSNDSYLVYLIDMMLGALMALVGYFSICNEGIHINTPEANFIVSFGHFVALGKRKLWISNKANECNSWTVKCLFEYMSKKQATGYCLSVIPYDANGNQLAAPIRLLSSDQYTINTTLTSWWNDIWNGMNVDHIKINKVEITYNDGSTYIMNL